MMPLDPVDALEIDLFPIRQRLDSLAASLSGNRAPQELMDALRGAYTKIDEARTLLRKAVPASRAFTAVLEERHRQAALKPSQEPSIDTSREGT